MASNAGRMPGSRASGTTKPDLWYYDRLPPSARAALANADYDWSSGAVYVNWSRAKPGWKSGPACASQVAKWDAHQNKRARAAGLLPPVNHPSRFRED